MSDWVSDWARTAIKGADMQKIEVGLAAAMVLTAAFTAAGAGASTALAQEIAPTNAPPPETSQPAQSDKSEIQKPTVSVALFETLSPLGPMDAVETELVRVVRASRQFDVLPTKKELIAALKTGETVDTRRSDYLIAYSPDGFAELPEGADKGADLPLCDQLERASRGAMRLINTNTSEVLTEKRYSVPAAQRSPCTNATPPDALERMKLDVGAATARALILSVYLITVTAVQSDGSLVLNFGADFFEDGEQLMLLGPPATVEVPGLGAMRVDGERIGVVAITGAAGAAPNAAALAQPVGELSKAPPAGTTARPLE